MPSLRQLEDLLLNDPADPFLLYGIAQEHAKAKNTAKAVEFYDRCLAADPGYCYAYFHKARAMQEGGDVEGAVRTVKEGLVAAKRVGDSHAASELAGLLDELE